MNTSKIEAGQPEQKPNSEQTADNISVSPAIGNTNVMRRLLEEGWNLSSEKLPNFGDEVEGTDDFIDIDDTLVYLEHRTCMLAGFAGGFGYFGEGFATDGTVCDYGLKCDTPKYWRLR